MIMDNVIVPVVMTVSSVVVGTVGYMIRNIFQRLSELERVHAVTEPQVRQIISDKIDPVKEDVTEIRKTLDYIFNLIYNNLTKQ